MSNSRKLTDEEVTVMNNPLIAYVIYWTQHPRKFGIPKSVFDALPETVRETINKSLDVFEVEDISIEEFQAISETEAIIKLEKSNSKRTFWKKFWSKE
jgi:hypothetical protein